MKPRHMSDGHGSKNPSERNIGAIAGLENAARHGRSAGDRLSDAVARMTGSIPFALIHLAWFAAWIVVNMGFVAVVPVFDAFPFSLLTLVVSLEAIFLSVFVLMSQNRMTREADNRAHLDLQIDLLAEQELTTILHMLHALCVKHDVHVDVPDDRVRQLLKDTDIRELARTLKDRLPEP
jgi:uncharacterized membrane protein